MSSEYVEFPATLILLPGLDGTEVFFRPLLAWLPKWMTPMVVQFHPPALMLAAAEPGQIEGVILASSFVRPPRTTYAGCAGGRLRRQSG